MSRAATAGMITIKKSELETPLRKVVRDELRNLLAQAEPWQSDPESPLYQALVEIRKDARAGRIKLLSDKEVWSR
ncbi:MAG: hypothetical protein HY868_15110 [Chloroflexi bacterium]|nr:hypothetical protein [Chloroflexota bacterium]